MKRMISALIAVIMMLSCLPCFPGARAMTMEGLISDMAGKLPEMLDQSGFTAEVSQGENRMGLYLVPDEAGKPSLSGEYRAGGQDISIAVSGAGVVADTFGISTGVRLETIRDILLQELGLEFMKDASSEDIALVERLITDILAGISDGVARITLNEDELNGLPAHRMNVDIDIFRIAQDLDRAVIRVIEANRAAINDLVSRNEALIREIFPGAPETLRADTLIHLWRRMNISGMFNGGMKASGYAVYAGDVFSPWRLFAECAGAEFEAGFHGDHLTAELRLPGGEIYSFDSRDMETIMGMIAQLPGYITEDAFEFSDKTESGARHIALSLDTRRLRACLAEGAMRVVSANWNDVNALIARYGAWFGAEEGVNADDLIFLISVMKRNTGMRANYDIDLDLSFPVETEISFETADVSENGAVVMNTYTIPGSAPFILKGSVNEWDIYLMQDAGLFTGELRNGQTGVSYSANGSARDGGVHLSFARDGLSRWEKFSAIYDSVTHGNERHDRLYLESYGEGCVVNMDTVFGETGISSHLYCEEMEVDAVLNIYDGSADATVNIEDESFMGSASWDIGMGFAALRIDYLDKYYEEYLNLADITANAYGDIRLIEGKIGDMPVKLSLTRSGDRYDLHASTSHRRTDLGFEKSNDGFAFEWDTAPTGGYRHYGEIALSGASIRAQASRKPQIMYSNPRYVSDQSIFMEANWGYDPGMYVKLSSYGRDTSIAYAPGRIEWIMPDAMFCLQDITPEGADSLNILALTLTPLYAGSNRYESPETVIITTEILPDGYVTTIERDGEEPFIITVDLHPETVYALPENVTWLSEAECRLMIDTFFGRVDTSGEGEAAEEASAVIAEEEATPAA